MFKKPTFRPLPGPISAAQQRALYDASWHHDDPRPLLQSALAHFKVTSAPLAPVPTLDATHDPEDAAHTLFHPFQAATTRTAGERQYAILEIADLNELSLDSQLDAVRLQQANLDRDQPPWTVQVAEAGGWALGAGFLLAVDVGVYLNTAILDAGVDASDVSPASIAGSTIALGGLAFMTVPVLAGMWTMRLVHRESPWPRLWALVPVGGMATFLLGLAVLRTNESSFLVDPIGALAQLTVGDGVTAAAQFCIGLGLGYAHHRGWQVVRELSRNLHSQTAVARALRRVEQRRDEARHRADAALEAIQQQDRALDRDEAQRREMQRADAAAAIAYNRERVQQDDLVLAAQGQIWHAVSCGYRDGYNVRQAAKDEEQAAKRRIDRHRRKAADRWRSLASLGRGARRRLTQEPASLAWKLTAALLAIALMWWGVQGWGANRHRRPATAPLTDAPAAPQSVWATRSSTPARREAP